MNLSRKDLSRYFLCYLGAEGTSWGWYTVFPFSDVNCYLLVDWYYFAVYLLLRDGSTFSVIGQEYVSRVVNVSTRMDLLYTCRKGASNEVEVTMNVTPALLYK